jgi:hypothetical protein
MTLAELIAAAERGAASVYHAVISTGAEIAAWESDPAVASLVSAGVDAANGLLARTGVGTSAKTQIGASDVVAALKKIAAADPTVPSIGTLATIAGTIDPPAAPLAAGIAGAASVAEAGAGGVATAQPSAAATPASVAAA